MKCFCPSHSDHWGMGNVLPPLIKRAEDYKLHIPTDIQTNSTLRKLLCNSLSEILTALSLHIQREVEEKRDPRAQERLQLFSTELYCIDGADNGRIHAWGLDLSSSPEAANFLVKHSLEVIPGVFDAMKAHHVAKFPKDKKIDSYGFFGLSGVIRERGTLSFITNGNCACLGHMPVEKQQDEGLYSESHNMDTPWQQLSMLVAVAATWKWIRTSIPEYN